MSDPFVDMRPNHDHNHWITKWIRSYITPAAEREELNRIGLLEIQAGAVALCVPHSQTRNLFGVNLGPLSFVLLLHSVALYNLFDLANLIMIACVVTF